MTLWHGYILLTQPEELTSGQWTTVRAYLDDVLNDNSTSDQPAERWHSANSGTSYMIETTCDLDELTNEALAQMYSTALTGAIDAPTMETYITGHWQVFAKGENVEAGREAARHHLRVYGYNCRLARTPPFSEWYVAPNGSALNDGSVGSPWTLAYAMSAASGVQQGDTIWMRGGEYGRLPAFGVSGYSDDDVDQPVILRGYAPDWIAGNRPIVFGGDSINAPDVRIWGVVVTGENQERYTEEGGSSPPTYDNTSGIYKIAPHIDLWNCIIHNANGSGIGDWATAPTSENYGVITQNNGWDSDDVRSGPLYDENGNRTTERFGHGHGFYMQNTSGTKLVRNCVFLPGFGFTYTAHGTGAAGLVNITLSEMLAFSFRSEIGNIGSSALVSNALIEDTIHWETSLVTAHSAMGGSAIVRGNLIQKSDAPPFRPSAINNFLVEGNRFVTIDQQLVRYNRAGSVPEILVFTGNHYHSLDDTVMWYTGEPDTFTLAQWQALGHDLEGSYSTDWPAGFDVRMWPNEKQDGSDPRIGIVVVVDWDEVGEVTADLSALGMSDGVSYRLFNAFNYFGDEPIVHVSDGMDTAVTIDLTGWTMAIPRGTYNSVAMQEPLDPMPDRLRVFIVELGE